MGVGFTKGPFNSKDKHLSKTLGSLASDLPSHNSPPSSGRVEARAVCG